MQNDIARALGTIEQLHWRAPGTFGSYSANSTKSPYYYYYYNSDSL